MKDTIALMLGALVIVMMWLLFDIDIDRRVLDAVQAVQQQEARP